MDLQSGAQLTIWAGQETYQVHFLICFTYTLSPWVFISCPTIGMLQSMHNK